MAVARLHEAPVRGRLERERAEQVVAAHLHVRARREQPHRVQQRPGRQRRQDLCPPLVCSSASTVQAQVKSKSMKPGKCAGMAASVAECALCKPVEERAERMVVQRRARVSGPPGTGRPSLPRTESASVIARATAGTPPAARKCAAKRGAGASAATRRSDSSVSRRTSTLCTSCAATSALSASTGSARTAAAPAPAPAPSSPFSVSSARRCPKSLRSPRSARFTVRSSSFSLGPAPAACSGASASASLFAAAVAAAASTAATAAAASRAASSTDSFVKPRGRVIHASLPSSSGASLPDAVSLRSLSLPASLIAPLCVCVRSSHCVPSFLPSFLTFFVFQFFFYPFLLFTKKEKERTKKDRKRNEKKKKKKLELRDVTFPPPPQTERSVS